MLDTIKNLENHSKGALNFLGSSLFSEGGDLFWGSVKHTGAKNTSRSNPEMMKTIIKSILTKVPGAKIVG